jgi:hypothetical protein
VFVGVALLKFGFAALALNAFVARRFAIEMGGNG